MDWFLKMRFSHTLLVFLCFNCLPASAVEYMPPYTAPWKPSQLAAISPKPLPAFGSCQAGTKFKITSINDLYADPGQLECVFAAGKEPLQEPLGYSYGYLLAAANTAFYNLFAEVFYQGDFTVRTQCGGEYYTVGWLSIGGVKPGTAIWSVGKADTALGVGLAEGEYPLTKKNAIIMDFTQNLKEICHPQGNESPLTLTGFNPFKNSVWPLNQFIDLAVIVGRDSDGGLISLNKAFIIPKNPDLGAATILFYATKTFDPDVLPSFKYGDEIEVPTGPNGETDIEYYRGSVESLLTRLNPARIFGDYSEEYLTSKSDSSIKSDDDRNAENTETSITGLIASLFGTSDPTGDAFSPGDIVKLLSEFNSEKESFRDLLYGAKAETLSQLLNQLHGSSAGTVVATEADAEQAEAVKEASRSADHLASVFTKAGVDLEKLVEAVKVVYVPAGKMHQVREQLREAIESTIHRTAPDASSQNDQ